MASAVIIYNMGRYYGKTQRQRRSGSAAEDNAVSGRVRKQNSLDRLEVLSGSLGATQVEILAEMAAMMTAPVKVKINPVSDFVNKRFAGALGDILQMHHALSTESFTKDKFEFALERIFHRLGVEAELAPPGNPGHDLTVDGERWSLKTQADARIDSESVMISKFMELGKGEWGSPENLGSLRDSMLKHMDGYDRIFSLRCLSPSVNSSRGLEYELVEIPKSLLAEARGVLCRENEKSTRLPRSGYCTVADAGGRVKFQLYFDGGAEQKLTVRSLRADLCTVHARWKFERPGLPPSL